MTDEQIDNLVTEISDQLKGLDDDSKLGKEERKRKHFLTVRRILLENIKSARAKSRHQEEMYNSAAYSLLTSSWGYKHPLLLNFFLNKFRWSFF